MIFSVWQFWPGGGRAHPGNWEYQQRVESWLMAGTTAAAQAQADRDAKAWLAAQVQRAEVRASADAVEQGFTDAEFEAAHDTQRWIPAASRPQLWTRSTVHHAECADWSVTLPAISAASRRRWSCTPWVCR